MSVAQPGPQAGHDDALERARTTPLDVLDVSHWDFFQHDVVGAAFERLRREAPVHRCAESPYGPYWSITRFEDVRNIEIDVERFSSARGISLLDEPFGDFDAPSFIAMDGDEHLRQRKVVRPSVAPRNLRLLEPTIRSRAAAILDSLPVGEPFDWVDRVSIELTTQMLATLFGFPFEQRRRLTHWSDVATGGTKSGIVRTQAERKRELLECLACFEDLWAQRAAEGGEPEGDLISMLARSEDTRDMIDRPLELLGNVVLLIVGGNDTTRNSISGGVLALHRQPEELAKLHADPGLVPNMVSEIIRWQTPLAHMRRTATDDVEMSDAKIRAGDKVVLWYLSANRDEAMFPDGELLRIDRENASQHLAFGFGRHRCMGAHLAEMQLRVLWEEILERFERIEVLEEPLRTRSNFVRGFTRMPVRVHPR